MTALNEREDRDRDQQQRFLAALHGVALQDRHGHAPGRRQALIDRMKSRRGGH